MAKSDITVLAIGSSHLAAIMKAYRRLENSQAAPFRVRHIRANSKAILSGATASANDTNQVLAQEIERGLRGKRPSYVLTCIGGNVHNVVGLVNHPTPFDFLLPGGEEPVLGVGAEPLPFRLMVAALKRKNTGFTYMMRQIRAQTAPLPMYQFCPPPPVADEAHIMAHPGLFGQSLVEHGLAPARLRLRLWTAACTALAEICSNLEITLVGVPAASRDGQGFLRADLYSDDPTHGNTQYGALVLEQVNKIIKGQSPETV